MQHKLAMWASNDRTRRFDRLLRLIANRVWLAEAARIVLASSGARTAGIDGMDKQHLQNNLDHYLECLQKQLLVGTYCPQPVKRIYIPKANGKQRPLGTPNLIDRIVQRAMLMALAQLGKRLSPQFLWVSASAERASRCADSETPTAGFKLCQRSVDHRR